MLDTVRWTGYAVAKPGPFSRRVESSFFVASASNRTFCLLISYFSFPSSNFTDPASKDATIDPMKAYGKKTA